MAGAVVRAQTTSSCPGKNRRRDELVGGRGMAGRDAIELSFLQEARELLGQCCRTVLSNGLRAGHADEGNGGQKHRPHTQDSERHGRPFSAERINAKRVVHTCPQQMQLFYHERAHPINSDSSSSSNEEARVAFRRRVASRIP